MEPRSPLRLFPPCGRWQVVGDLLLGVLESDSQFACYSFYKTKLPLCLHPQGEGSLPGTQAAHLEALRLAQGLGSSERWQTSVDLSTGSSQAPCGAGCGCRPASPQPQRMKLDRVQRRESQHLGAWGLVFMQSPRPSPRAREGSRQPSPSAAVGEGIPPEEERVS